MREVKWTGSKGNELKITIKYQSRLETERSINADGYMINTKGNKIIEDGNIVAYIDGKKIESCWNINFWHIVNARIDGYFCIQGLSEVAFNGVVKEEIEKMISDAINEGTSKDVVDFKNEINRQQKETEIKKAKSIIEKAEKQKFIPTRDEYKTWKKDYNDMQNEGGEGYIPELVTREEYEKAREALS